MSLKRMLASTRLSDFEETDVTPEDSEIKPLESNY